MTRKSLNKKKKITLREKVHYYSNSDTIFHFNIQDAAPCQIDGVSENESNSSAIMINSTDDWLVDEPSNFYESVGYIEISDFNSNT